MKILLASVGGYALDRLFGDPACLPHPVIWMGRYISAFENRLRPSFPQTPEGELACGALLAASLPLFTFCAAKTACHLAQRIHPGAELALQTFWCAQALASKGLADESRRVYDALLSDDLPHARESVGRIVGRDTERLDAEGVAKAAVETVAENASDGVIAPLLCMLLGGAPLSLTYKAINTMDSMVGYKSKQYLYFGRAAAKLDDAANYLPSRLAALLWVAAAALTGQDAPASLRIWRRDAGKHLSPNAGQTEAACAGALGVRLGGEAWYFGERYEKATLGDDLRPVNPEDILTANRMMYRTGELLLALGVAGRAAARRGGILHGTRR